MSDLYAKRFSIERTPDWYLLKLQEEMGELSAAFLKISGRGRLKGETKEELQKNLQDEISDVLAMTLLFARNQGVDPEKCFREKWFTYLDPAPSSPLANKILENVGPKGHVIWDWNGTLLNDVDHAISTMNSLLAEHDLLALDRDRYRMIFDFPVLKYYSALGFDFKKESFENLCHRFVDRFMAGFKELPLFEEMKATVTDLHKLGVRQSILSATIQSDLDEMIGHFGLSEIFTDVYGIDNKFGGSKIERGRQMVRSSGIPLAKTLIVGDTLHDLEVATELGIQAVLVSHGHQCPTRLRRVHKEVVEVRAYL